MREWPVWFKPLVWMVTAIAAGGTAIDGCQKTTWHGAFGGLAAACAAVAIASAVIAVDRADKASK